MGCWRRTRRNLGRARPHTHVLLVFLPLLALLVGHDDARPQRLEHGVAPVCWGGTGMVRGGSGMGHEGMGHSRVGTKGTGHPSTGTHRAGPWCRRTAGRCRGGSCTPGGTRGAVRREGGSQHQPPPGPTGHLSELGDPEKGVPGSPSEPGKDRGGGTCILPAGAEVAAPGGARVGGWGEGVTLTILPKQRCIST